VFFSPMKRQIFIPDQCLSSFFCVVMVFFVSILGLKFGLFIITVCSGQMILVKCKKEICAINCF